MKCTTSVLMALPLLLAMLQGAAFAQDQSARPDSGVADIIDRMNRLERENAAMKSEIDELRTQTGDNWLTERRADEIRGLVAEVLADADTRSSLLQNGMTGGWSDHFFLASPDGRFKLQFEGHMQIRFVYNFHDEVDNNRLGFENTRTRLGFTGHVFSPDITYMVRGNFSRVGGGTAPNVVEDSGGEFRLQDSWVRYQLNNDWSIRLGQFKLPFNREELVSDEKQLLVERSLLGQMMGIGRSQGFEIQYRTSNFGWTIAPASDGADDRLGNAGTLVRTRGANTAWSVEDVEYAITTRFEWLLAGNWRQFEDFTSPSGEEFAVLLGVAGHYQQGEYGLGFFNVRNEVPWIGITGDVSVEFGGATLYAAYYFHHLDTPNFGNFTFQGVVLQGAMYWTPKIEPFARFEFGWADSEFQQFQNLMLLTGGFNYYLDGHDVKLTADLGIAFDRVEFIYANDQAGYRSDGPNGDPQFVTRIQFQLLF